MSLFVNVLTMSIILCRMTYSVNMSKPTFFNYFLKLFQRVFETSRDARYQMQEVRMIRLEFLPILLRHREKLG